MTERKKILLILLPILLLALALRLVGIENPIFEREPSAWRQIHTNVTIQGYLHHGFKFFYPEANFLGNPGYYALEFPLYQYLVAWLYKIFGENVIWGRFLTIAASLGALVYLYLILRKYLGEVAAGAGALFFAVVPLSVYYGRTVMVDTSVLFLSLGFTYHFLSYLDRGRRGAIILALLLAVLAVLIKMTVPLLFFGPLVILPFLLNKKAVYKKWEFYLFLGLPFLMDFLWKNYAESLNLKYASIYSTTYTPRLLMEWAFGPWQMRLDPDFYRTLFMRMIYQELTWAGIFLMAGGIILSVYKKELRPILLYLLAGMVYLLTFTNLNYVHDYYQLPLIPVCGAFVGVSVGFMTEKIKYYLQQKNLLRSGMTEKLMVAGVVILWGVLILIPSVREVGKYSKMVNWELIKAGKQIQQFLPPEALVVAVTFDEVPLSRYPQLTLYNTQPKVLYAMGHKGWNLSYSSFTLSKINLLRQEGAQFLIMDLTVTYRQEALWANMIVEALRKNYREIFMSPRFIVYDLNQPPGNN